MEKRIEKQALRASPLEVPEQRPDLYWAIFGFDDGTKHVSDAVWLVVSGGKVLVRAKTGNNHPLNHVGYLLAGFPGGPKYTGPIDDEMMANILIYGG